MVRHIYEKIKRNKRSIVPLENKVRQHFIKGPFVEVAGPVEAEYKVQFIDNKNGRTLYETQIKNNHWTKCNFEYFVDWKVRVLHNDRVFYEENFNAKGKRIYVAMDSKALGDTLAWIPQIDEFRKKHDCELICSTFHNSMFIEEYSEIEFVEPGQIVENLYAMYSIGLYYNPENTPNLLKNPNNFLDQPLQKMCSDILGLDYTEVKPRIKKNKIEKDENLKQVCIAIHGTAQSKYWNNPKGWQGVVDWLNEKGYTVKLLSREGDDYMGNKHPTGIIQHPQGSLSSVIDELQKSKAFIGIGSGLSWLSWATNTKTVLISGFSYDWAEMEDCVRITPPKDKCIGCFNRIKLDAGDWNWCPDHKGTERQFECTKSITSEMVIKELEKFL
jgi:autotransporter strand-loop-strand O-heptosyltransferase